MNKYLSCECECKEFGRLCCIGINILLSCELDDNVSDIGGSDNSFILCVVFEVEVDSRDLEVDLSNKLMKYYIY